MTELIRANATEDRSEQIVAAISTARDSQQPLYICGGDSKRNLLGRTCEHNVLNVGEHQGIIDYEPRELVITARAGTPLCDIIAALRQEKQKLGFEPPLCGGNATLGGTLACNLSGPARPYSGAIRDHVLGVQLINGNAEVLNFGGRVMKNVAGYDVSRLQAGALGTLGVLTQISLKVTPVPEQEITLCYELSAAEAVTEMNLRAAQPWPLSAACWVDGVLYLRLSGAASAIDEAALALGGQVLTQSDEHWRNLCELTLPFFAGDEPLWRFSQQSSAEVNESFGPALIDWGGAQRWLRGEQDRELLQAAARGAGGHVTLVRGGDRSAELRSTLSKVEQRLQQRLKAAFDPLGILNPGRLYSWL